MNIYKLDGFNSRGYFSVKRAFRTREAAIKYAFKFLSTFAEIQETYDKGNHLIEYKCSERERFFVSRQVI